jgi:branched-chain amino acid transport system substrate-binding protein
MKAGKWDTVLGPITFDKKGDITVVDYVVYQWDKTGNYAELPSKPGT